MESIPRGWSLGKLCAGAGGHAEVRRRGSSAVSRGHAVTPKSPRAACAERQFRTSIPQRGSDIPCPRNIHSSTPVLPTTVLAGAHRCSFLPLFPPAPKPLLWVGQGLCSPPMCHLERDVFPEENLHQHSTFTLTSITSKLPALQASIRSTGVRTGS